MSGVDRSGHPPGFADALPFDPDRFEAGLRELARHAPFRLRAADAPADFRRSSVAILFWREADDVAVLMTRRASALREHPGMMAFPGGRLEAGEDWRDAALRETHEEVGIAPAAIEVLGRLDDAWSGSRYRLASYVGWLDERPRLQPSAREVASVHTPRVSQLLRPDAWRRDPVELNGERFYNATIDWHEASVFGLSADLLVEALSRALGERPESGDQRRRTLQAWLRARGETFEAGASVSRPG